MIFCTTLKAEKGLDILSEDLDWLPYDVKALGETLSWHGMEAEEHFPELLERKIYTYNCLSACVTYPGAALGYENYAEAANDPAIEEIMKKAVASLSKALAAVTGLRSRSSMNLPCARCKIPEPEHPGHHRAERPGTCSVSWDRRSA